MWCDTLWIAAWNSMGPRFQVVTSMEIMEINSQFYCHFCRQITSCIYPKMSYIQGGLQIRRSCMEINNIENIYRPVFRTLYQKSCIICNCHWPTFGSTYYLIFTFLAFVVIRFVFLVFLFLYAFPFIFIIIFSHQSKKKKKAFMISW